MSSLTVKSTITVFSPSESTIPIDNSNETRIYFNRGPQGTIIDATDDTSRYI